MVAVVTNSTNQTITQYNVQTGAAGNTLNNVAPGATSGVPVISQGASAQPIFGTAAIAGGGTNATSMGTSTGIVKYDGTSLVTSTTAKIDSSNRMTNTSQPAFKAYLSSASSNVTGDGTAYQVIYDTKIFDVGTNYSVSTGAFTAPVTGTYLFYASVFMTGLLIAHTQGQITFVATQSAILYRQNPFTSAISGQYNMMITETMQMTAADTIYLRLTVSNGTKVVGLSGGQVMAFGGYLIC